MAEYRFSAQVISRKAGRSATGASAYRAAERIVDLRTGDIHDYRRKGGVEHSEIIAPDHAPNWVHDRTNLWNRVEAVEQRRDAQVAREFELMLPRELSGAQHLELVRGFVKDELTSRGMVADLSIHNPRRAVGRENPHAHVLTTMRDIGRGGFEQKNRGWNSKELLTTWRERWADHCNRALQRAGRVERVDHRSYADRGIDREAQPKLGPAAAAMERRGERTERGDLLREVEARNTERRSLMESLSSIREAIVEIRNRIDTVVGMVRNPVGAIAGAVLGRLLGEGRADPTGNRPSREDLLGRHREAKADYHKNVKHFMSEPDRERGGRDR